MVSAIVLNWGEIHVVRHTIDLLAREPEIGQIIVVDNGSTDGSQDYLRYLNTLSTGASYMHILLNQNTGPSVARNLGLRLAKGEQIFLIDGDVLYVPGTIREYLRVMNEVSEQQGLKIGCVGYNDHFRVLQTGTNGVTNVDQADTTMPADYTVSNWFPMAWTQYGLFDGDMLRRFGFAEKGPFGEAGHGYEDDWLYHDMDEEGFLSLGVNKPLYYHDAHYSLRLLKKENLPSRTEDRAQVFYERWGRANGWRERLGSMDQSQMKPFVERKDNDWQDV
jgi:glycosyltransferase involved in cell wall biosynthesis